MNSVGGHVTGKLLSDGLNVVLTEFREEKNNESTFIQSTNDRENHIKIENYFYFLVKFISFELKWNDKLASPSFKSFSRSTKLVKWRELFNSCSLEV